MLSDAKLRALRPQAKPYKVADANGLYVYVAKGRPSFRFDYRLGGKRRTLTMGRYPAVSLHEARRRREAAEALLADGRDPCAEKQARKRQAVAVDKPTFEQAARAWHAAQTPGWTVDYAAQVLTRLEADVFPHLGRKRFAEIARSDILACLGLVEDRGVLETARRLRQYVGAIHRFAGANDDSIIDPTPMLRGALKAPPTPKHHASIKADQLGGFLGKLRTVDAEPETRLAIRFTILTACRTGETIGATWPEFEHDDTPAKALWRIPAARMKMKTEHLVPLSRPAVKVLAELREITGDKPFCFPGPFARRSHMSNNAMLFYTYRMGYSGKATIHGMRGTFSTWANESGFNSDVIELCLAHDDRDKVRSAYNSAQRLPERRALLQAWGEFVARQELTG